MGNDLRPVQDYIMGELAEEASEAYKDVAQVVQVTHEAGISRKVVKMRPLGVIKG